MRWDMFWMVLLFALSGCATPKSVVTRGWIGCKCRDVARSSMWTPGSGTIESAVIGLPAGVNQAGAALVVDVTPSGPLVTGGLERGDLVLAMDGQPVESAEALRAMVSSKAPGSPASLTYWRGGTQGTTQVTIGRETYEIDGTLTVGFPVSPVIDLWPFDDGIDLLGLVRCRRSQREVDVFSPESTYLHSAFPPEATEASASQVGSGWDLHVLVVGGGRHERILSQEVTTPANAR